jgi:hypothetical protein
MGVLVVASEVDQQKAAPLGLFVLILLGVACYFLFKSMSRHLRHVRDEFPAAGFFPHEGPLPDEGAPPDEIVGVGDVTSGEGLTRPAPVTLTRGRATEPRLIEPREPGPRVIEPRVIEPRVIEPRLIESRVIEPNTADPAGSGPQMGAAQNPGVES